MTVTDIADDGPLAELVVTARLWRVWALMGWQDIRARYRGSVLGPFWVAGGIAATSLGAGLLYSRIIKVDAARLVPFIAVSITLWTLIGLTLAEACTTFIGSAGLLRNTDLPRPVHVLRTLSRNLIVFGHGALVAALVLLIYRQPIGPWAPLSMIGFALLLINLTWASWVLAMLSARFRDTVQLTVFALQFAIFLTPIFWFPSLAGPRFVMLSFNPFYHLLEVVRAPLLGYPAPPESWWVSGLMAAGGSGAAAWSYVRYRHQIVFWA